MSTSVNQTVAANCCIDVPASAYALPWVLRNPHIQTIWAAKVAASPSVQWTRERWSAPDGDFVDVDWAGVPAVNLRPVLVLLHGLEGSSGSHYARAMAHEALLQGWDCLVPHFRGCSGEINRKPRAYHSGDHAEIEWILQRVATLYPSQKRMAVGVSLGGNALMLWAGRMGAAAETTVQAVAAVCSPLDLVACGDALEAGLCRWIYTPMFLRTMKRKAQQKWSQFPGLFDLQRAMAATTLREFDDVFTAPLHGFDGVDHYWRSSSAKGVLNQIEIPALVLHALDDPFVPAHSLPRVGDVGSHVTLHQTPYGGHVGYAAWDKAAPGVRGHVAWMPRKVCHWMRSALDIPTGTDHG